MSERVDFDDWLALTEGKARYCRLLDGKDWAGFAALFTEDFVLDVSDGTGLPPVHGRDAAVAQIRSSIETAATAHQVHSPEIAVSGEEAQVIWAMQDRVVWGGEMGGITGYGHYHERWVKQGGRWLLAALRLTRLHLEFDATAAS